MLGWLVRSWLSRMVWNAGLFSLLGGGGYLVWDRVAPSPAAVEPAPLRLEAAADAAEQAARAVQENRGDVRLALMPPVRNDPEGLVDGELRRRLAYRGAPVLVSPGAMADVLSAVGLGPDAASGDGGAVDAARRAGADGVVLADSMGVEVVGDLGARAAVGVRLLRASDGATVFSRRFEGVVGPAAVAGAEAGAEAPPGVGRFPAPWRAAAFIVGAALLPLLAFPLLKVAARRRSNSANALALSLLTALDAAGLWALAGGLPTGWWGAGLALAAAGLSFLYNLRVLHMAHRFAAR